MPPEPHSKPSFSAVRRWAIGLNVLVLIFLVFSVVAMVNYISRGHFHRFHVSTRTRIELHPLTLSLLQSLTNDVRITLYYNQQDKLFSTVADLVKEYADRNPKHISVQVVDYFRDAGAAQRLRDNYASDIGMTNKDLVIFECNGHRKPIFGRDLADYDYERVLSEDEAVPRFQPRQTAFRGEKAFTGALLAVTDPKSHQAYVLQGHREHDIDSGDPEDGYLEFKTLLQLLHINVNRLELAGTNTVPTNCDLLIIPGPRTAIPPLEVQKINDYLERAGSRLLVLFDAGSLNLPTGTGLERLLERWGVKVGRNIVGDYPKHSSNGSDVIISAFAIHPVVNPLYGSGLYLIQPRTIERINSQLQPTNARRVEELAQTGPEAYVVGHESQKGAFSVMAAVETGVQEVVTEHGPTRMLLVGDAGMLSNHWLDLDYYANRDFAVSAVNWLVDRAYLPQIAPRSAAEYRFIMTRSQLESTELVLLAGFPGAVLLLGGLVWLRRRR